MRKRLLKILLIIFFFTGLFGCNINDYNNQIDDPPITGEEKEESLIDEDGIYISKDEVALYILTYKRLPKNYRTKSEIDSHISNYWTKDNLLSVGGDIFYNREGLLPKEEGRVYYEADINYRGESGRNSERIVFSSDGLIFYTKDHYRSFIEYDREERNWKSS